VRNWWRQDGHVWHPAPAARPSSAPGAPASPAPLDLPRGVVVVLSAPDRDSDRRSGGGGPAGGRRCYRSAERHLNRSGPLTSGQWGSGSGPARLCWPSSAGSPACTRSENDPHSRAASKQAVPEIARGARRQRVGPQGKALQSIAPLGLLPATIAGWVATWPTGLPADGQRQDSKPQQRPGHRLVLGEAVDQPLDGQRQGQTDRAGPLSTVSSAANAATMQADHANPAVRTLAIPGATPFPGASTTR
jgi:hypothetical protein